MSGADWMGPDVADGRGQDPIDQGAPRVVDWFLDKGRPQVVRRLLSEAASIGASIVYQGGRWFVLADDAARAAEARSIVRAVRLIVGDVPAEVLAWKK